MFGRRKIAALVAEFLGSGVLILLILSVQRSTIGVPFFVAAAAGLTFAFLTFVFYRVSGAQFNPALTIALWTARRLTTIRAISYVVAQLLGAYAAYYLYTYLVKNQLEPIGGEFDWRILTAELVGTALFALGYSAAVYQRFTIGAAAAVVGLAYMIGSIAASPASVGLINPGVALGVKAWVWGTYILGPILGAIIGVNLYNLLFAARDSDTTDNAVKGASSLTPKVADKKAVVAPATVTTVKPVRKIKTATSAKTRTAAKRTTRKKS